jgi:hypothetical protein
MLVARLLSKIFKKNGGIVLVDSQGQKYICGKPNLQKPLTIKLLKKDLNWKLAISPDLNFRRRICEEKLRLKMARYWIFLT